MIRDDLRKGNGDDRSLIGSTELGCDGVPAVQEETVQGQHDIPPEQGPEGEHWQ